MFKSILHLTAKQKDTLIGGLRKGLPFKTACNIAKTPTARIKYFLKQGEELFEDPLYDSDNAPVEHRELVNFYVSVKEAGALAEETWVGYITHAAEVDWKAAKALLQARNPDDWSDKPKTEVNVNSNNTHLAEINLNLLSINELEALEAVLLKLAQGDVERRPIEGPDRLVLAGK